MNIINKKKLYIVLTITIGIALISLSYFVSMQKLNSNKQKGYSAENAKTKEEDMCVQGEGDLKLKDNAEVIFKVRYKKSGEVIEEKKDVLSSFNVDTKNKLENKFKEEGYEVEKASSERVQLIREEDKYSPNKYVLGIKDDRIAIYKTDIKGNMYIEDKNKDITDKKIKNLKEQDINFLTKGNKYFQCNTKEEALARLEDYE